MAERQLPKLNVAGSIPVSRSNTNQEFIYFGFNLGLFLLQSYENELFFSDWLMAEVCR